MNAGFDKKSKKFNLEIKDNSNPLVSKIQTEVDKFLLKFNDLDQIKKLMKSSFLYKLTPTSLLIINIVFFCFFFILIPITITLRKANEAKKRAKEELEKIFTEQISNNESFKKVGLMVNFDIINKNKKAKWELNKDYDIDFNFKFDNNFMKLPDNMIINDNLNINDAKKSNCNLF